MSDDVIITAHGLSKHYKIYNSAKDRLVDWLSGGFLKKGYIHSALTNVSFEVNRGEFIGIIGRNGSGKSTLLKILSGVIEPTTGSFKMAGSVLSLLELGTGFNPELTGRQNIFHSAQLLDLDANFLRSIIEEIEAFSDIGEYFDHPVKMYSSGMYVRLAMSIFLHLKPDIFIIDEALSVGDVFFQQKCFSRIDKMVQTGTTFLLVSHDINLISRISHRVMLLDNGNCEYFGDKRKACALYYKNCSNSPLTAFDVTEDINSANSSLDSNIFRVNLLDRKTLDMKSDKANISALRIIDHNHRDSLRVESMQALDFLLFMKVKKNVKYPILSIVFKDRLGQVITAINHDLLADSENHVYRISIPFTIQPGDYSFDIGIGDRKHENANTGKVLHEIRNLGPINVFFDYILTF